MSAALMPLAQAAIGLFLNNAMHNPAQRGGRSAAEIKESLMSSFYEFVGFAGHTLWQVRICSEKLIELAC
jgi:hypothetical protein